MKNQNDLIISIVAIVLALIIAGVCFGTKREPIAPPAPETVNLAPATLPQGDVVMASSLPGAGSTGSGSQGGGAGGAGASGPSGGGKPKFTGASLGGK
ncbi:MAG: hypothetical protein IT203_10315 [Fimbriimonadaceae bacterium]|nr:hypothetical protein [Fimbriimonadaceae bacterium]